MSAEIVNAMFCGDYDAVFEAPASDGQRTYEVRIMADTGAHCTCQGFKYRRECRHIADVWLRGCFWNPQWYSGGTRELRPRFATTRALEGDLCPACGGPVIPVRIAV